jgi:tRNA modification GTPase
MTLTNTIVAPATPQGVGALGIIRLSGTEAIAIAAKVFRGKPFTGAPSHTLHYGFVTDGSKDIDEVMVSIFRAPKSFTTEDVVEISHHGSPFIQQQILTLLIQSGARPAEPGEFTLRAFLNGRIDLSQAEAVADIIASNSAASHEIAINQLRGGFKQELEVLRTELVNFASLIELELDFSEEDVEFADRTQLSRLIASLDKNISALLSSFKLGNAIKEGVPVVIAGEPNAGKSTLLNKLLNEDRAIVSEIAGTTRDVIEDQLIIDGIAFRFIDTAGLRETDDTIEKIGVQRSYEKIKTAAVLMYIFDAATLQTIEDITTEITTAAAFQIPYMLVANKSDLCNPAILEALQQQPNIFTIAAKTGTGVDELKQRLLDFVNVKNLNAGNTIVTNIRHYDALQRASTALQDIQHGLQHKQTTELIALDIKHALEALGEITGAVTNDEILGNIFGKFCIGK